MARRRPAADQSPVEPGHWQRGREQDWWKHVDQQQLQAAHDRAAQLVASGHGSITWEDVWGRR